MRAADGHDMNIHPAVLSYVVVPQSVKMGFVYHVGYYTAAQVRNILNRGIFVNHGGRHKVFNDTHWPGGNFQWPASLTEFGV